MNRIEKIDFIKEKAQRMRCDCIEMGYTAGGHGAHFGPALSCVEEIACLYFGIMNHDPKNPLMDNRDRFVLSKGHACLSYYAALIEAGYIPKEQMKTFKMDNSILSGHPGCHPEYGLEAASGSLGNGFAFSCGMANTAKIKGESHHVFCVMGDGECNEGVVWEAAMNAVKNKLDNLILIVDRNGFQLAGKTVDIMNVDLEAVWKAFGWNVKNIADGNDVDSLLTALEKARETADGKPHVIISNTVKGKGVSFMENNLAFHAAPINQEQYHQAMKELQQVQIDKGGC